MDFDDCGTANSFGKNFVIAVSRIGFELVDTDTIIMFFKELSHGAF